MIIYLYLVKDFILKLSQINILNFGFKGGYGGLCGGMTYLHLKKITTFTYAVRDPGYSLITLPPFVLANAARDTMVS